jgi:cell division protein FtsQ
MKKVKNILLFAFIVAYLVVILGLTTENSKNRVCREIKVQITDSLENGFLSSDDILEMANLYNKKLLGYPIGSINTEELETKIRQHPSVREVQIFKCVDGSLHIAVEQRRAILRIINQKRESYYLSEDGVLIPLSDKFTARILVANGFIAESYTPGQLNSLNDSGEESLLHKLFLLANYIENDQFWKAQIEQIYVDRSGQIELIPRVGAHIIEFGYPDDIDTKFRKLYAFYKQGLDKVGWNKYETINLKYKDQIVCKLR